MTVIPPVEDLTAEQLELADERLIPSDLTVLRMLLAVEPGPGRYEAIAAVRGVSVSNIRYRERRIWRQLTDDNPPRKSLADRTRDSEAAAAIYKERNR